MNKLIAKKRYKAALKQIETTINDGVSVSVINQVFVDKNGKECSPDTEGGRLIMLRRPKIVYKKHEK